MSGELEFAQEQQEEKSTIALSPEQEERFELITRGLQEVTSGDIIRKLLADGEVPRLYWGGLGVQSVADDRYCHDREAYVPLDDLRTNDSPHCLLCASDEDCRLFESWCSCRCLSEVLANRDRSRSCWPVSWADPSCSGTSTDI